MVPVYMVPSANADPATRAKVHRLNQWGGKEKARKSGLTAVTGGLLLLTFVARPIPTSYIQLTVFVAVFLLGLGMIVYGGIFLLLPVNTLPEVYLVLTDPELIRFAEEWRKYIGKLPAEQRQAEHTARYAALRQLSNETDAAVRKARMEERRARLTAKVPKPAYTKRRPYVVVSSAADPQEQAILDKINLRGGIRREMLKAKVAMVVFVVLFLTTLAPYPKVVFVGLAACAAFTLYGYFRFHKPIRKMIEHVWLTTTNVEIVLLDKDWRAYALSLSGAMSEAIDHERFITMRRLLNDTSADDLPSAIAKAEAHLATRKAEVKPSMR